MPINETLNKENVAHIHHRILCSHEKWWVCVLCRDMDESGSHHSQQTDTRTENQTPHVLTHRQVLNNENTWTPGGEHHTLGSVGRGWGGQQGSGKVGWGITWGEMPERWWGDGGNKPHCHYVPMQQSCMIYTCTPEPKVQFKKKYIYIYIYIFISMHGGSYP